MDDRELPWYLKSLGCPYVRVQCGDCAFSVCYKDDKGKVEREIRNMAIYWLATKHQIKPFALAKTFHLAVRSIRNILWEYNKRNESVVK